MSETGVQRLFLALWPDEPVRSAITSVARRLDIESGKRVVPQNLHITLVFLGNVDAQMRKQVEALADGVVGHSFELILDRLGWWPKRRVVWLGASDPPQRLVALVEMLTSGIAALGHPVDERPYQPHLTLMRKATRPPRNGVIEPVVWPVDRFCLAQSTTDPRGAVYRVRKSWWLK